MDDDNVPKAVRDERPSTKSTLFTIRFFPTADYHWVTARDMTLLTSEDIQAFLAKPPRKSSDLQKAYKIAQDPTAWNDEQNRIVREHEAWVEQAEEAEDEEEDEDASKSSTRRRSTTQPRKRAAGTSAKASTNKRARAAEDVAAEAEGDAETPAEKEREPDEELDPATRKVREWRYKLQRAFLNKGGVIVASDMDAQDATFKTVEAYTDMTVEQLKTTKIGKVMKRIHQLPDVPHDDKFHFRERAGALVKKWGTLLGVASDEKA
ncbi:hypothetical protein ACI68E_000626 [Malassezia pachydermatis]